MYLGFFGLASEPFSIAPDPRFLYLSERHREALAHLRYGLERGGGGFVVLTGEIGAGKTTVCRCLLHQVPANCNLAYLFNPRLTARELLQAVCHDFGVPRLREGASIKDHIDALNAHLLAAHAAGRHNVLIIDEAQQLDADVLEQLRLLTNLETDERKLLQIVLIGQPELRDLLALPQLEQLAQRVVARFHLGTLDEAESGHYVRHRLAVAGLTRALPFDEPALRRVHRHTQGVPRRINLLCDRALLGGYAEGTERIGRHIVDRAAGEVFGDARPTVGGRRAAWAWGGAALAAAGLLAVIGWLQSRKPLDAPHPAAASAPVVAAASSASSVGPATASPATVATPEAPASAPLAVPPAPVTAPTVSLPDAATAATDATAHGPAAGRPVLADAAAFAEGLADAPADEQQAWHALAAVWKVEPVAAPADPCRALRAQGLLCTKRRGTLGLLRELDRPAILPLYLPREPTRFVLLTGMDGEQARVRVGRHELRVTVDTLTAHWRDEFGTLWRPPAGARFDAAGAPVSVDPGWLARQLARAGGSDSSRSATLLQGEERRQAIQAFQRARGLDADGQVGTLTLMQLTRVGNGSEPSLRD